MMTTTDPVDVLVEGLVDSFEDEPEEWEDVVRRAKLIDAPERATHQRRRWRGKVAIAVLVVAGLTVPGALALLGKWESPKQFLTDRSEPAYAKNIVRAWAEATGYVAPGLSIRLLALMHAFRAHTPSGEVDVYALRFDHNDVGLAIINPPVRVPCRWTAADRQALPRGVPIPRTCLTPTILPLNDFSVFPTSKAVEGPANTVIYRPCPGNWALQRLDGGTDQIGKTYGYVIGRAAPNVASVDVLYHDGTTTEGVVGNGYFLAWIKPSAGWTNVTLIAENATGHTLARLVSGGYGGIPYLPTKPRSPYACAP
jgi:hypothetical protein